MKTRKSVIAVCLVAVAGLAVGGYLYVRSANEREIKAAYAALEAADAGKDTKTAILYLPPEIVKLEAAQRALDGLHRVRFGSKKEKLEGILGRHGLSKEATKDINLQATDPADQKKARHAMAGLMTDHSTFLLEFPGVWSEVTGYEKKEKRWLVSGGNLTDLKIDGDRATGVVKTPNDSFPIEFIKVEGRWRIIQPWFADF